MAYLTQFSIPGLLNPMINKTVDEASAILLLICSHEVWVKSPMIGPFPCAYVDPVFISQSYDICISTRRTSPFSCAYAYGYVDPVVTCLHMCLCLCLCLCASENQALGQAPFQDPRESCLTSLGRRFVGRVDSAFFRSNFAIQCAFELIGASIESCC